MRFLSTLGILLLAGSASARDIYVDNTLGDDRRDGSSTNTMGVGGPCRSLTRALRLAQPGDRIVLAKTTEPYRESVTLQAAPHSGTVQQPFEIIGNGAVLDGTQPIPKDAWEFARDNVYRFRPPRTSFQLLFLSGEPARRKAAPRGGGVPNLSALEWCLYDGHIYFRPEPGKFPREYDLSYCHLTVGITVYEVRHLVIRDLTVQGFQLDGINAHDNVFDATLQGLHCRGNGRSGISIGGSSRVLIDECTVGDNGAAQVRCEGYCRTQLLNCSLLENTAPAIVRDGGQPVVREFVKGN